MSEAVPHSALRLAATGNAGFDDILGGGLASDRLYLIEDNPGSGKTTLGLQFLLEGVRRGEPVLYVTLSETKENCTVWPARMAGRWTESTFAN
jgi:circadian clock protein KaiC